MLAPPLPPDEEHRLQVLLDLHLLDTAPEERFDRITRMAARMFHVPVAVVGLVDGQREWFKSRVGVPETEVARQVSFCAHAILQDAELVVEDALLDERFADNPFVTAGRVRFYAGAPLRAPDGSKVGTLCLIDEAPRSFDEHERALLRDLAAVVSHEFTADELRRALQQQRDGEAWLRALLNHLPEGVLLLDETARVLSANPAAGSLFGIGAAQLAGREAQSFAVEALAGLLASQPDGAVIAHQVTGRRDDGSNFPLELVGSGMTLGGRRRYAVIARDGSARLEQAWRLRAAGERRHKAFTLAAHELRTPLASILGFSELLLKRDFDAATARELLEIVNTQAATMSIVVNQVFELARIEAGGRQALRIASEPLADILTGALAVVAPLDPDGRIALAPDPALPPVAGDAQRLSLALANVLTNALQYSAPGSPIVVRAWVEPGPVLPCVLVQVADRGVGMAQDDVERLFDAFHRGVSSRGTKGNGLGMAIVKEIIDIHNGNVEVESEPGKGTSVTLRLPAGAGVAHG